MVDAMSRDTATLTREQVRLVDGLAVSRLKIPSIVLMENAGKNAADWIFMEYGSAVVTVFCGPGNNGGDGFVIARHLHNAGCDVHTVLIGDPAKLTPDARTNHDILLAMGQRPDIVRDKQQLRQSFAGVGSNCVVVDALLGTGFRGQVREPMATAIYLINEASCRARISIDVPSGLDCDTGAIGNVAVRADVTITFVAPKRGFRQEDAYPYLGKTVVAGIGTPPALTESVVRGSVKD